MFSKKSTHYLLIGVSLGLLLAFVSYNDATERNVFGLVGHGIAHFSIGNLWGLSAYFFPFAGLWVAYLGLRKKLELTTLFWQCVWGFLLLFFLNLFLLNTPLINTPYAGLFSMVLHAFLLNLLGENQAATFGSLLVESLMVAVAFVGCGRVFLPKGTFFKGAQSLKASRTWLSNAFDFLGRSFGTLASPHAVLVSRAQLSSDLLGELPFFARVAQNEEGLFFRYPSSPKLAVNNSEALAASKQPAEQPSPSSLNIRRYREGLGEKEPVGEAPSKPDVAPEASNEAIEAIKDVGYDIDLSFSGLMSPIESPASESVSGASRAGDAGAPQGEDANPLDDLKKKPLVFNKPNQASGEGLRASMEALITNSSKVSQASDESINQTIKTLEDTTRQFGIRSQVVAVSVGPVITQYELTVEPGVKISRIVNLSDNIALALAAPSIRIVAPIPGKSVIGIEVPNQHRQRVALKDIVGQTRFQQAKETLPIALGKSIFGEPVIADLSATPHLLIAGATGSGKSVCVNAIICSLLLSSSPSKVRFLMIDPKMVELNVYNGIPHLLCPVITNPKKAAASLKWIINEMESRYYLLERYGVRNIDSYNSMVSERANNPQDQPAIGSLPYIVVVIDEFSDLMMLARKEIEDSISRLAAMSRAVGIHLILATQRPSVNVITGVIKANFPSRIAFQVSSRVDSRTILDDGGAEKLLGKGDMLFRSVNHYSPERIQGNFLSDGEVNKVVLHLRAKSPLQEPSLVLDLPDDDTPTASDNDVDVDDVLYDRVVELIRHEKKVSASFLQRKLKIGYNRAARIVEIMEERGLVGPADGSKPREVYL